jgi:hypothetical protein
MMTYAEATDWAVVYLMNAAAEEKDDGNQQVLMLVTKRLIDIHHMLAVLGR